mmetsp:Transcript_2378/g.3556  ORF Transcript_2378/g.3556 Transcript_2378/m.3556 type:complete len:101 (+) Transcript_2378:969-1271(+)
MLAHSERLTNGPIFSTGILTASLLKNATKRNSDAGERERSIGSAALSLHREVGETPRLEIMLMTSSEEEDPLLVSNPGHVRRTFLASYFRSFIVEHKTPK